MIICSHCGASLDSAQSHCPECGERMDEATAGGASYAKTPETSAAEKTSAPADPSASRTSATESPSHEELMAFLHSLGTKLILLRRWVNRHGKAVVGGLTAILLVLLGIFGQEWWQRWQHPQPVAIWIEVEANASQVKEGTPVKLTARTSPADNVPREFKWQPAEMIQDNGRQSVTLNTNTSQRHTESYPVTVSLIAVDQLGNNCVAVKDVTITIVPPQKWNNAPELTETIHMEGSPAVKSGTAVSLEALATDKDKDDRLTYTWSVGSNLVTIEGNGNRRVLLRIPKDFALLADVPLTVKLMVSDGINNIVDSLPLTVLRGGTVRIARPKPKVPKLPVPQTQPGLSPPPKVESTPSLAAPQSSPLGSVLGRDSQS